LPVIHNATICVNREWALQNEETVLAFLRSMIDAIHFFKTRKSRSCEILQETLAPLVGIEGDDGIEHLHQTWSDLLSSKPYPHPLAVWNVYNLESYIDELYGGSRAAASPPVNPVI
jgi:hypothetical protein